MTAKKMKLKKFKAKMPSVRYYELDAKRSENFSQ